MTKNSYLGEAHETLLQRAVCRVFPPGQMVVPGTTIMAKGMINGDHGKMHPTMSQPSFTEGKKQSP